MTPEFLKKLTSMSFKQRKGASLRVIEDPTPSEPDPMVEAEKRMRLWFQLPGAQDLLDELYRKLDLIRHEEDVAARDHMALISAMRAERTVQAFIKMIEDYRRSRVPTDFIAGEPDGESIL